MTNEQLLDDFAAGRDEQLVRRELLTRLQPHDPRRAEVRAGLLGLLAQGQDKEFILRAMPVVVVGLRGDPEAAKAVLSLYERLEKGPMRMVIISDVGDMRALEAVPTLTAIVRAPPPSGFVQYDERPSALDALGQIGGPAVDFLIECATGRVAVEGWLKNRALVALAHARDLRALPLLRAEVKSDNAERREIALMGMGELAEKFPQHSEEARSLADHALRDESWRIRWRAAAVFNRIGTPEHLGMLESLAASDPHLTKMMDKYRGEVQVYPVREAARKAIEAIRRRFKLDEGARR